ncbi:hypothetical protein P280DRAFT_468070 [Massarina eburnea CBS 473.64]|uniref:Cell wall anchored protein n=1 Tax=Massarina eburnea CBS 473.64 TaxID=1395130 RepID=A0A6A6S9A5_9PLEO|nr:hypothetical protein P280DRAFT_468070 [Massarina eburnea CBS 473.64]
MSLIWHLLCLITFAGAQPSLGPDPVQNFCMRWGSQTTVKNDVLYIDSGVEKYGNENKSYLGAINYMMTIPLTQSWSWESTSDSPTYLNITREPKNITNPNTNALVPNLWRGYMFHGPKNISTIYRYGGTTYMGNQSYVGKSSPEFANSWPLWSYTPGSSDSKWKQYKVGGEWMPNHGAGADATDHGLGFYLNGQIDTGTSSKTSQMADNSQEHYTPLEGMVVVDLVKLNPVSPNISTSMMKGSLPRVGGTLEYIAPVGYNGILVALGGQIQPKIEGGVAKTNEGELIDFESVDIFDIDSYFKNTKSNGTWYQQNTAGDIPAPRIDFCSVSISAQDNSSHHIYIYGGYDPTQADAKFYDDVVVLSLPSFQWTTVWPQGGSPRIYHNCHIGGNRQMITVGGNTTNMKCDWEKKGVAVFEMSALTWGSVFQSNVGAYEVPGAVQVATNGTTSGNATIGEPVKGWSNEGLHEVFWKSRWTVPKTWTSNPPASFGKKSTNTGAIVGGAVGGTMALLLVGMGIFIWHRKKHRSLAELHSNDLPIQPELSSKIKYELQGINENNPAELPGLPTAELTGSPAAVEADDHTATRAAELPGTNTAPGGSAGVPQIRTPGDDLPEVPEYTPGLKKPPGARRRSSDAAREREQDPREDYF